MCFKSLTRNFLHCFFGTSTSHDCRPSQDLLGNRSFDQGFPAVDAASKILEGSFSLTRTPRWSTSSAIVKAFLETNLRIEDCLLDGSQEGLDLSGWRRHGEMVMCAMLQL
jgi:hypothetical protein